METFFGPQDHDPYLEWLDSHPGDFVLHANTPINKEFVLHRATCRWIGANGSKPSNGAVWTNYPKRCSTNPAELTDFAYDLGARLFPCGVCRPATPALRPPPTKEFPLTPITRPAAMVRQASLKLYATSIKVSDLKLPNFYTINKLDPEEAGPGYQRLLNQGRAKRLAEYLLDGQSEGDAFLPTSIFLATSKDIPFDPVTNTITFDVAHVGPFNVVDGQHRIAGLIAAADKNAELLNFEIPVNIAVGLDDVSQMCHFLIVNTTQRPVDKAVEQQIVARLTQMIDLEEMPTIPRWIRRQVEKGEDAKALAVANYLNTDPNSPWCGKIRMANDDESTGISINQPSFVKSLIKYVFSSNNLLSNPEFDSKRNLILRNYWNGVVELLVDDESPRPSVIFKTTGVDLFHIVSATVFTILANQRDFKKETIKAVLLRGFGNLTGDNVGMSNREWWQRGGAASGLNSAAVRKLATALNHAINVQDDVGKIAL
jgi:DGQHR domain-containing protein